MIVTLMGSESRLIQILSPHALKRIICGFKFIEDSAWAIKQITSDIEENKLLWA